jgi:hypothetical protein
MKCSRILLASRPSGVMRIESSPNKYVHISACLREFGVIIPSKKGPRFTKTLPTIYEPHELSRFLDTRRDSIVDYAR